MDSRRPLSERLKMRAASLPPDKPVATILRIIEARSVLAEQRLRGMSWAALTRLLAEEGVNLSDGTLRNYMRMIGAAEAALRAGGMAEPTDREIHAALYGPHRAAPAPKASDPAAERRAPLPMTAPPLRTVPLTRPAAQPSLIRNPDRDL